MLKKIYRLFLLTLIIVIGNIPFTYAADIQKLLGQLRIDIEKPVFAAKRAKLQQILDASEMKTEFAVAATYAYDLAENENSNRTLITGKAFESFSKRGQKWLEIAKELNRNNDNKSLLGDIAWGRAKWHEERWQFNQALPLKRQAVEYWRASMDQSNSQFGFAEACVKGFDGLDRDERLWFYTNLDIATNGQGALLRNGFPKTLSSELKQHILHAEANADHFATAAIRIVKLGLLNANGLRASEGGEINPVFALFKERLEATYPLTLQARLKAPR